MSMTDCFRRPNDGAIVHVTSPLLDDKGRHIGHVCECGQMLTTTTGRPSSPTVQRKRRHGVGSGTYLVDNKSHHARLRAAEAAA